MSTSPETTTEPPFDWMERLFGRPGADWPPHLEAVLSPTGPPELDPTHLYCCDRDLALCGKDIAAEAFVGTFDPAPECGRCGELDDANVRCGMRWCRTRQTWRRIWGRL
jgi:hypothetical protein